MFSLIQFVRKVLAQARREYYHVGLLEIGIRSNNDSAGKQIPNVPKGCLHISLGHQTKLERANAKSIE